ncbi:SPFH domain-containing protein [Streptomyces sp. NPDC048718]|uniref:SPFH domain-containing protein n=1 Tax=Streptomyces sp. NPDC048718 TaxID=3365587 RepID=UPI00372205C6
MKASTPMSPAPPGPAALADSGAAASRDAARTARRLTDGRLRASTAPPGDGPEAGPESEPERDSEPGAGGATGAGASDRTPLPPEVTEAEVTASEAAEPEAAESEAVGQAPEPARAEEEKAADAVLDPVASADAEAEGGTGDPEDSDKAVAAEADTSAADQAAPPAGPTPQPPSVPEPSAAVTEEPQVLDTPPTPAPDPEPDPVRTLTPTPVGVGFAWMAGAHFTMVSVPAASADQRPAKSGAPSAPSAPTLSAPTPSAPVPSLPSSDGVATRGSGGRRRAVIGVETTGTIPVHLLFRDEPAPGPDDGTPATASAPASPGTSRPSLIKTRQTGFPTPPDPAGPVALRPTLTPTPVATTRARSTAASAGRPVPAADPKLVERPGPVLPGWVGVTGGLLALFGCAVLVWWMGAVPREAARVLGLPPRPYDGIGLGQWSLLALGSVVTLFFLGGIGRGRVGYALVLTLFGDYRGTVRRTGLLWVSPLLLRRRVDVRLRHWRSEPLPAVDAKGTALDVVVLVVWRVRDTVRAALGVDRHEEYLREQVEAAMARVLSQLPADAFHEDAPTLRDAEAVGEALTRTLSAECAPVGIDVYSAQPTRIEYAPAVAAAMQRRRIAAIDAKHRDSVLTSVVDAVDDVVHRLTSRGLVELDDDERKALVKDLTVAFSTGRTASGEAV